MANVETRECSRCLNKLPLSKYHKDKKGRGGLRNWCVPCEKRRKAEYYERNKEAVLGKQRAAYAQDPNKFAIRNRAWRQANPEWKKAYDAAYYCQNQQRIKANIKRWRNANPDLVRSMRRRRKALKRGATKAIPFTVDDVSIRDNWTCQICHELIDPTTPYQDPLARTIDHVVPLSKGGADTLDNVQLAHRRCNDKKGTKVLTETGTVSLGGD